MTISRRTTIRAIAAAGGFGAVSGTVLGADEHEDDEKPAEDEPVDVESAVSVAHLSPDAPNVDVYVDDEQVLADVPYGAISAYLELQPGTYTVTITAADDPETVAFEGEVTIEQEFHTIAAIGELEAETFEPLVLVDAEEVPEDASLVRPVHASPDAPAVDVFADGEPLFENLSFGEAAEYAEVPPGTYTLDIFPAEEPAEEEEPDEDEPADDEYSDEDEPEEEPEEEEPVDEPPAEPVASFEVDLEAGTAYTGFAAGYLEPGPDVTDRDFTLISTVDGPMALELPERAAPPDEADDEMDDEADDEMDDEADEADDE